MRRPRERSPGSLRRPCDRSRRLRRSRRRRPSRPGAMAGRHIFADGPRRQAHTIFVRLDLPGNTDPHLQSPVIERVGQYGQQTTSAHLTRSCSWCAFTSSCMLFNWKSTCGIWPGFMVADTRYCSFCDWSANSVCVAPTRLARPHNPQFQLAQNSQHYQYQLSLS